MLGQTSPALAQQVAVNALAASMEGRAIARPNRSHAAGSESGNCCFNGGPSNCSAKLPPGMTVLGCIRSLQWRAEQLLGQTLRLRSTSSTATYLASMEGRAIARPNGAAQMSKPEVQDPARFNGGPSNCLAKPDRPVGGVGRPVLASMEGRAIARPNWRARRVGGDRRLASMEGRAIARPNPSVCSLPRANFSSLQWRAEQLLGQTPAVSSSAA